MGGGGEGNKSCGEGREMGAVGSIVGKACDVV